MFREPGDFRKLDGRTGFLNGYFDAYLDEVLWEELLHEITDKDRDAGTLIGIDIFPCHKEPVDKALKEYLDKLLGLGYFREDGSIETVSHADVFAFSLDHKEIALKGNSDLEKTEDALHHFIPPYWYPSHMEFETPKKEHFHDLNHYQSVLHDFAVNIDHYLKNMQGVYKADRIILDQMRESEFFQLLPFSAYFFIFEDYTLLLTDGYDD